MGMFTPTGTLPKFAAYQASNQTIPTATFTKINFDTEEFDVGSNYDTANKKFVAPAAGYFICGAYVYSDSSGGSQSIHLYKNGSVVKRLSQTPGEPAIHLFGGDALIQVAAADFIEIFFFHTTGSDIIITGGQSLTRFYGSFLP